MGDRNLDGAKSFVRDVALRVGKPGRVLWVNPSGGPGGDITGAMLAPLAQRLINYAVGSLTSLKCLRQKEFSFLLNGETS